MRKLLALLATAALVAGLAACGGDDDDSASDATGDESTQSTDAPDSTEPPTNGDDYSALLEKARTATYRVTYANADTNGDDFTISQDPPNRALIFGDERYVTNQDGTFLCTAERCVSVPGVGATALEGLVQGFFGAYSALLSVEETSGVGYDVEVTDDEEIAGRDARCAEVSGGTIPSGQQAKVCVDSETGVLLLAGSSDADRIEATEFGDPQPDDFEASGSTSTTG
jgi:hypothetical protein